MSESFNKSSKLSADLGFNFDIVIVRLNLTNLNVKQNSKLKIDVKFNNNNIKITSSCINVSEFKSGHMLEFTEKPSVLKDQLFKNPLECEVFYDDKLIGTSTFPWPDSFISCIAEGCGRELTRCDEADIMKENKKVGQMEIIARLQIKCYEFQENQIIPPKIKLCDLTDNILYPNDVMFVVNEDKYGSVGCSDVGIIPASQSSSSARATCLDLSEFRHVHGKTVPNTDIIDSVDTECCKSKKSLNQYKQIDYLLNASKELPIHSKNKPEQQQSCQQMKPIDFMSDCRTTSCSSTDSSQPCRCISDENSAEEKSITCQSDGVVEKPTKRYCPLCHDNITWLPKYAACPQCGFRPFSYKFKEKPYDDTLTASKILKEFGYSADEDVIKEASFTFMKNYEQMVGPCRCTCQNDKICAHCRIKKLCKDILSPSHKGDGDCAKCETQSSDMYNVCTTGSPDCRPFLGKVFRELKDLFDKCEANKKNVAVAHMDELKNQNSASIYGNESQKVNRNRKGMQKSQNVDVERDKYLVKNFQKHVSCKNKVFDYNNRRKYIGSKSGHKSCFSGQKHVPRNMGWLWNTDTNGLRTGWVPGAIRRPIKVLMQHFLNQNVTLHSSSDCQINENEKYCIKEPTLHICKKNGIYRITLRPLKGTGTVEDCTEYKNMKPIEFKITKNPLLIKMRKLKKHLKDLGFAKCTCHKPIPDCCCRSFLEKRKLEHQCCKECHKMEVPNCTDNLVLSDTTDSEAEFDFGVTPPAGAVECYTFLRRNKKVSSATQYQEDDWKLKPENAKRQQKYLKLHNCAIGNRFGKAFGPYGLKGYSPGAVAVEGVHEPDGKLQKRTKRKGGAVITVKGGGVINIRGPKAFKGPDGKFSMAQYTAYKGATQPYPKQIAEKKRQKMALLKGANPPLLCQVDRRGKPLDICSRCLPISNNAACLSDNRIC